MRSTRVAHALLAGAVFILGMAWCVNEREPSAEANHAWLFADGVGFEGLSPTFGWLDVYVHSTALGSESIAAIDAWRELRNQNLWLLRYTTNAAEAEIEIMDTGATSVFGGTRTVMAATTWWRWGR